MHVVDLFICVRFSKRPQLQELELEIILLTGQHDALFGHLRGHFQSALRHGRALCVGTVFVDELLNMSKLHLLALLSALHILERVCGFFLEVVIISSVRVQLIVLEMDDFCADFVEEGAVVKDAGNIVSLNLLVHVHNVHISRDWELAACQYAHESRLSAATVAKVAMTKNADAAVDNYFEAALYERSAERKLS